MPTDTFWLYWDCRQCGHKAIRGDNKQCPKCGHQQDHEERLAMEASANNDTNPADKITDQTTLEQVEGPNKEDWWCNNCDRSVTFSAATCPLCSAPRDATFEDVQDLRTAEGVRQNRVEHGDDRSVLVQRHGPMEGREILAGRGDTKTSGLQDAAADLKPVREMREPGWHPILQTILAHRLIVAAVIGGIALIWLLIWSFTTHQVEGKVTQLNWSQTEYVERFTPVTRSDWRSDIRESTPIMPVNGSGERAGAVVTSCEERRHHDEQYVCGSRTVQKSRQVRDGQTCRDVRVSKSRRVRDGEDCRTTSRNCRSNKNGSQTCTGGDRVCTPRYRSESYTDTETKCDPKYRTEYYTEQEPQYCTRPIFRSYCYYNTYEWKSVNTQTLTGTGHQTRWPELPLLPLDRRIRNGTYTVHLEWMDGDKPGSDTSTVSEFEYRRWNEGEKVVVDVRNIGGAAEIHRVNE